MACAMPQAIERLLAKPVISARLPCRKLTGSTLVVHKQRQFLSGVKSARARDRVPDGEFIQRDVEVVGNGPQRITIAHGVADPVRTVCARHAALDFELVADMQGAAFGDAVQVGKLVDRNVITPRDFPQRIAALDANNERFAAAVFTGCRRVAPYPEPLADAQSGVAGDVIPAGQLCNRY